MTVTRDVIDDLLPGYFAGDASADTRRLIEDYFSADPEFRRMAERFHQLHSNGDAPHAGERAGSASDVGGFDRARALVGRHYTMRGMAIAFALGALLALAMAFARDVAHMRDAGLMLAGTFGAVSGLLAMINAGLARDAISGRQRWRMRRGARRA